MVLTPQNVLRQTCIVSWRNVHEHPTETQARRSPRSARLGGYYGVLQPSADAGAGPFRRDRLDDTVTRFPDRLQSAGEPPDSIHGMGHRRFGRVGLLYCAERPLVDRAHE